MRVGVISDTHGLLRLEALVALRGADHIIHAGDVGNPDILAELRSLAPLTAIRGNIDRLGICAALPATEIVELNGHLIYVVHSIAEIEIKPEAAGISAVIYGHSHKPNIEQRGSVLYLNPGSAGPRRFSLPITIANLTLNDHASAEIVTLHVADKVAAKT